MQVNVQVPATTANLGPGFDALGMALNLYIRVSVNDGQKHDSLELMGETQGISSRAEDNLVCKAARQVFSLKGHDPGGLAVRIDNSIPVGKGLGSSASAIAAGMFAANRLAGDPFSQEELLDMAVNLEGHPDNVVPAVIGGLTASMMHDGRVYYHELDPGSRLRIVVAVPEIDFPTKMARAALPEQFSLQEYISSIQKTAFLLVGLMQRDYRHLKLAFDRIQFQEIRSAFIPGYNEIVEGACEAGALGVTLSGAGPSLAAFTTGHESEIGQAMMKAFLAHNINASYYVLSPSLNGVQYF